MEKEISESMGKKPIPKDILQGISLAAVFYSLFYLTFLTGFSHAVSINILYRDFRIPVIGWVCVCLYVFLWSRLFGEKIASVAAKGTLLGILIHLSGLLCKLNIQLSQPSPLSGPYLCYIKLIAAVNIVVLLIFSVYIVKRCFLDGERGSLFFFPIVFHFLILLVAYIRLGIAFSALSVTIGLLSSYLLILKSGLCRTLLGKIKQFVSDDRVLAALLFTFGFALRVAFSFQILKATGGGSLFVDASDDGRSYDPIGWAVAQDFAKALKGGEVFPTIWDPGYILFLSLVYKIFGHNFYALTAMQSFINGLIPVAIFYLSKIVFSRRIGIFAALFAALDQALIMYSIVIGTEALFTALLALLMLVFVKYLAHPEKVKYQYMMGALFGMAVITRSMLMILPVFMLAVLFFVKGRTVRYKVSKIASLYLIAAVFILPITLMNFLNTGQFHLIAKSNDRLSACWESVRIVYGEEISPSNLEFIEMGINPFLEPRQSALEVLKDPVRFMKIGLKVWPKRVMNFFAWPNFGYADPIILVNSSRFANDFGSTMEFYIFLICVVGVFVLLRQIPGNRKSLVVLMIILYFICVHVFLYRINTVRYRMPIIPYIAIVFALGLDRVSVFVCKGLRKGL